MDSVSKLIYGYVEARSGHSHYGEIRYVGKSCSGLYRPRKFSCHDHGRVGWAIAAHQRLGILPEIVVLESLPAATSRKEIGNRERRWVAVLKSLGADLWNVTDGGDGMLGCKPSKATLIKRSLSMKKKWQDPDYHERLLAKFKTLETTQRISQGVLAHPPDRTKSFEASSLSWADPISRETRLQKLRPIWQSQEHRLKRSVAHGGGRQIRELSTDRVFQTQMDAARAFGVSQGNLRKVLIGTNRHVKGYRFEYL